MEALREREQLGSELLLRLRSVETALEPVCDLLELRPRPQNPNHPAGNLHKLPAPLRVIFSKFDTLATFGTQGGVSVKIDTAVAEPPEKRQRLEGGVSPGPLDVLVTINCPAASSDGAKAVHLRFTHPSLSVVAVACEGATDASVLDALWPDDDGHGPLAASLPSATVGRPYGWAQILAGLRDEAVVVLPSLSSAPAVTATDVVLRVRAKVA